MCDARFKFELYDLLSEIWVSLRNLTDGNQTISATVKHASGCQFHWNKEVIKAGDVRDEFLMTFKFYKKWAPSYKDDVLKLDVSITLTTPAPEIPITLRAKAMNEVIMEDEATKDYSVRCDTKTFRVHKSFLCAR